MATEAQLKAQSKYDKQNTMQITLKLNVNSDADILAKLSSIDNKQGYIKTLVRQDLGFGSEVLTLESIKYLLLPIVKKYEIKSLSIFGSYGRNEATPESDVDILIDGGNYCGLVEYMSMVSAMKKALGKDVDVTTVSSLSQGTSESDLIFKSNVERDKVVLV